METPDISSADGKGQGQKPKQIAFWITGARGVFAIILGIALVIQPDKTMPILGNFMGLFWLVSGAMSIRWGVSGRWARGLPMLAGIIGVLTGLIVITRSLTRSILGETVIFTILGAVILLTGLLHVFGGFRKSGEETRQWSWASFLLGIFEVILGTLLLVSPLDRGPIAYMAASIWALLGGFILMGDALRIRAGGQG
jgi:uncharacterized membrane protein HdeD (DUF308 family)